MLVYGVEPDYMARRWGEHRTFIGKAFKLVGMMQSRSRAAATKTWGDKVGWIIPDPEYPGVRRRNGSANLGLRIIVLNLTWTLGKFLGV